MSCLVCMYVGRAGGVHVCGACMFELSVCSMVCACLVCMSVVCM